MDELITRLVRCGIPEQTAHIICADFARNGMWRDLLSYVLLEEIENGVA